MPSSERLLILGATGQLGRDLVRAAAAAGVEHEAAGHEDVEVTDGAAVAALLARTKPTVVINSAAFHQVDACEGDPRQAYAINTVGALVVARAATEAGTRCVFVSTDYVFAGDKTPTADGVLTAANAYVESDPVGPLNVYGASKVAGEQAVALAGPGHLVVRVASLYGVAGARGKGGNFIETILKRAKDGAPLNVVNDQWMTPTYTVDAAQGIVALALRGATGTVHVTGATGCTWHALAAEAVRLCGLTVAVNAVPAATYPSKVRRPRNSALSTARLASLLGTALRPWREALPAYLREKGHIT